MKLLCITDPLTHPPTDTTVELYNRLAEDPRFELFHLEAGAVGDGSTLPVARVSRPLAFGEFLALAEEPTTPAAFAEFDLVFSRTDKPYPPGHLEALIRHEDDTRFIARPSSVRRQDDRVFCRSVASRFMPAGIVTRSMEEAGQFIRSHGKVVAKRNRSYGGKGVAKLWREGIRWLVEHPGGVRQERDTLEGILEPLFASDPEPFEFVRYLERVTAGDKRVLVVDGQIYGGFLRVATDGGWINNLTSGGGAHPATVTPREEAIILATCQRYHDRGLYALGYDFLVDDSEEWTLSEINASGNIGGYGDLERTSGLPIFRRFLDWLAAFPTL
jgi:glutathione synthase/RimK-type ligase-like ATP-grasp enzyme